MMHASRTPRLADDAFLAALMHDVGIALILRRHPDFLARFDVNAGNVDDAGLRVDGMIEVNHAAIGAHVARNWKLPAQVCEAIALHHTPPDPADGDGDDARILSAAIAVGRRRCGAIRPEEWACWEPFVRERMGIPEGALEPPPA